MTIANIINELTNADLPATGQILKSSAGYLFGWGTTVGNGVQNWAPGALFIDTDASADAQLAINEGTSTTASWQVFDAFSS